MRTALTTDCWVLHLNGGYMLAISIFQVAELVNNTPRLSIPQAQPHCCYLISWRNKLIPLVDYHNHSPNPGTDIGTNTSTDSSTATDNIMIVKFLGEGEVTQYLAFAVTSVEKYTVNDSEFSTPHNQTPIPFSSSIISAFDCVDMNNDKCSDKNNITYIIDMKRLCSS